MITAENLTFEYADKRALHDVSFEIEQGSITALVGPNGAGKTTLLRCLAGLDTPFAGTTKIMGINVQDQPRKAHKEMGYLSDFFGLYDDLTIHQCLTYMAWSHHIPEHEVQASVNNTIERLGMQEYTHKKAGTLSRGWRQRLGIAQSIIHNPRVLLLDEPASGLDPESRAALSELLMQLRADGMTIMVSSHILAELEDYCTEMLVIRDGKIIDHVKLHDYQEEQEVILQIAVEDLDDKALKTISSHENILSAEANDAIATCRFKGSNADKSALLAHLVKKGIRIYSFAEQHRTLQNKYLELAEKNKKEA